MNEMDSKKSHSSCQIAYSGKFNTHISNNKCHFGRSNINKLINLNIKSDSLNSRGIIGEPTRNCEQKDIVCVPAI